MKRKRKKKRARRICPPEPTQTNPSKNKGGRPPGTYKKYPFEQTRLGFMLKYETPAVFDLIIELTPAHRKRSPPAKLITIVCSASDDPSFGKPKFRKYLNDYIRTGVYCKRGKTLTPERKQYYERLRRNKLRKYIDRHRDEIETLRCAIKADEE